MNALTEAERQFDPHKVPRGMSTPYGVCESADGNFVEAADYDRLLFLYEDLQNTLKAEQQDSDLLASTLKKLMEVMPQDVLVDNEEEVNAAWADAKAALHMHDLGITAQDVAETMPPRQGYEGLR